MKKLNNKIDMFCYRHPRFGIPNLMLYVVVISLAVWLLSIMDSSRTLMSYFAFSPELILKGQVWRLITFMFIPQDTSMWALLFFYFYYWIGSTLEREWGTARFNIFIFSGVLLTIIYGMVIYLITKQSASIGTYYIYLSMFFSFATLYPDTQVLFMFIIPVKIKWMAILDACYFAYIIFFCAVGRYWIGAVLPLVALLNFFVFFAPELGRFAKREQTRTKQAAHFHNTVRQTQREQQSQGYRHKCAVCGRTDVTNPELQFRYCSKCAGYHCFCSDHIFNHVHFTDENP